MSEKNEHSLSESIFKIIIVLLFVAIISAVLSNLAWDIFYPYDELFFYLLFAIAVVIFIFIIIKWKALSATLKKKSKLCRIMVIILIIANLIAIAWCLFTIGFMITVIFE